MAKSKAPNPNDVLRLGRGVATVKANMPKKRWANFVKGAHKSGYTVRSALSDTPNALKERTPDSLRRQAAKTVATSYAPARAELTQRESAVKYLDQKRATDDASYRQWLMGETEKLSAQGRAADATLATQQQQIATETETAAKAARADSLQRMSGGVSDPNQSTALASTSAADDATRARVANQRDLTAQLTKAADNSRVLAGASVLAQQSAREASRTADTTQGMAEVSADRKKLVMQQAADAAGLSTELIGRNSDIAQRQQETDLAKVELGQKSKDLAFDIAKANQDFRIQEKKYSLDAWKAKNKAAVDAAKLQIDYDRIAAEDGRAAAKRKLDRELARRRSRDQAQHDARTKKDDKKGVTSDERDLYRDIKTANGLLNRWHAKGSVKPADMRNKLRDMGIDDATIDVAENLRFNHGKLTGRGAAIARKLGITHIGYFFGEPAKPKPKQGTLPGNGDRTSA